MPTRRIAEKSAALEAVKLLHEAKELDDYLKPFTKDDDDSDVEDEAKMAEKRIPNAGTEKRPHHYPNRVSHNIKHVDFFCRDVVLFTVYTPLITY